MNTQIKSLLIFIFGVGSLFSAPITNHLEEKLQNSPPQEFIKIYISLEEIFDFNDISAELINLKKDERRELVKSSLKTFYDESQSNIIVQMGILEQKSLLRNIKSLWITNVILCEATGDAIYKLSLRNDIRRIDYDEYRVLIPEQTENNYEPGVPNSREITWNVTLVNADDVWTEGYTGQGIIVSVIDTGVNYNHQDLSDHMWNGGIFYPLHGYDFANNDNNPMDDQGHGTHCAGTVAGDGTAGSQTGVAPDSEIMALKVLDSSGGGYESSCWEAIEFSIENDADVMSLSLGWLHAWGPDRDSWRNSMNTALFAGVIASVAAGNEANDYGAPDNVRTPGDIPPPWLNPDQTLVGGLSAVVSVGATNINDNIAGFSARGPVSWENISPFNDYPYNPEIGLIRPDLSAPGENIKSLAHYSNTGYESGWSGTSMATPCVAGVMALMLSKDPNLSPAQMSEILETTSLHLGSTGKNNTYGSGRVDAFDAVEEVFGEPIPPYPAEEPIPFNNQTSITLETDLRWSNGGGATSYLVFLGTDNPPTNLVYGEWVDSPIFIPLPLEYNTQYFWEITSINQYGETNGEIWSFTTTGPPDESYESGDFSQFPWQFQGYNIEWPGEEPIEEYSITGELDNINWIVTNEDSYGGLYSAKSAAIDHNQASTMSITVNTLIDDYIGFQYRVASEYSPSGNSFYDGLMFFIDDEIMGYYQPTGTGDTPWGFATFPVSQGEHTFTWAFVKDGGGGSTDMDEDCVWIDDIYFPSMENIVGNVSVELMGDWNMVGLPLITDDLFYTSVFPGAIENTLYYFSPTGYVPSDEFTQGVGYWLRFVNENTADIQGQLINELSITLNNNWNLITGISSEIDINNINDPQNLIIPNTVYAYGSSGYYTSNNLQPGKGYWLRSSGEGEIVLTSSFRSSRKDEITDHLSCNMISINNNTLYFGNDIPENKLVNYSLPPLPPERAFDVRFNDNMRYSREGNDIHIQSPSQHILIEYDLTLTDEKWQLSLENREKYILSDIGSLVLDGNIEKINLNKLSSLPESYNILKSFPNPFNAVTNITYILPEDSYIQLDIFSLKGELVYQLENKFKLKGMYTLTWDGKNILNQGVGSGVYLIKYATSNEILTEKLLLLK